MLEQLVVVAESGRIVAAAERLDMTQPALTRAIAKLERRAGELAETDEHIAETVSGRRGRLRVSATPLWMRTVVAPAALCFHTACPGVGLSLRTAPFAQGVHLLEGGGERTCTAAASTADSRCPRTFAASRCSSSPPGIVARRDHPLQRARPTPGDLVRSPWLDWLDGYRTARTGAAARARASLGAVLERLHERTGERAGPVFLAGVAAGLRLLAEGPWLSWFPFTFLARSP